MILFSDKGRGFEAANIDDYFTMQFNEEIWIVPPPPTPETPSSSAHVRSCIIFPINLDSAATSPNKSCLVPWMSPEVNIYKYCEESLESFFSLFLE